MATGRLPDPNTAPLTAKGDLYTYSTVPARLAVASTAGYVLTVDSAEATGLKWAAPSGGSTFAGVSLKNTAAQSTTNVTQFTVLFDSEIYDTDGFHSTTTNTSRITIPSGKGGYYLLTASLVWGQNATGTRYIYFFKNGSDVLDAFEDAEGYVNQTVSGVFNASAGDYFELRCYQNSGGALNVLNETRFFAAYLGA